MSLAIASVYDEERTYEDGNQHADDKRLLVRFEVRAVKNDFKSGSEGRAIFEDVEYIQIIVPGSRDVFTTPLTDEYRRRFSDRYRRWKEDVKKTQTMEGTVLGEVTWLTKSQVAEFASMNVFTVEQLADMADVDARGVMGIHDLRKRAKTFLAAAAQEAPMQKLQAELEQRDNHIKTLEQKIAAMEANIAKMMQGGQNGRR
jgi:hypothetical protein